MLNFLRDFFAPKVDKILSDFHAIISKLENAIDFHNAAVEDAVQVQAKAKVLEDAARAEVNKAKVVADKIKSLLS